MSNCNKKFIAQFTKIYGNMPIACGLFAGLEIVARNDFFTKLPIFGKMEIGDILSTKIKDKNVIDDLLNLGKSSIILASKDSAIYKKYHFTCHTQIWQFFSNFLLVTIIDESSFMLLSDELRKAYSQDKPTKLLLPMAFKSRLSKQEKASGVLFVILFKLQNSYISPACKVQFLIMFSQIIKKEFGDECIISRDDSLGLTIFVKNLGNKQAAAIHIVHFKNLVNKFIKKQKLSYQFCLGTARYPIDTNSYDELQKYAKLAMQKSLKQILTNKKYQTSAYNYFSPSMLEQEKRRQKLGDDLPKALQNGQIVAWFQPIFSSQNKKIISFEALVRWQHPEFGNIVPKDILSLAQENSLIDSLTAQMILQSARQAIFWPKQIKFAINVSAGQLTPALVDLIRQQLNRTNIQPGRLEIELTENMIIDDFKTCIHTINRLRSLGVSIAMDDFGSGYTSFNNLRKLKFDKIKIDKSICAGLPTNRHAVAIFISIFNLAKSLNIEIVAEGIENNRQLEFLQKFNCGIQGFIYEKPLSPKQISLLRASKEFLFPNFL